MRTHLLLLASLLVAATTQVATPDGKTTPACPTPAVSLTGALASWSAAEYDNIFVAAHDAASMDRGRVTVGQTQTVELADLSKVRYVLPPQHPGAAGTKGGMLALHVEDGGTYRVVLGSGLWIDVVQHGKAVASSAHAHGPACSGIRKMVDFTLLPGDYVLQLSGGTTAHIQLMVTPLP